MPQHPRKNLAAYVGVLLITVGIASSATMLERIFLPEGTVEPHSRRAVALGVCRLLLLSAGAYFLLRRPRFTIVHLAATTLVGVISVVFGIILLQLVFVPPRVVAGWRSFAPKSEQNELRFRGQPISYGPEDYVVALLGDSHVEAMALSLRSMPEQRLESYLGSSERRVKVFSVGAGGYGQDQQLLALEQYFEKHRADLVVLWQTPGNDVWNNVFKTHMINRNPKPTFWLADGKLCGPSEAMEQPLANSRFVMCALWQRVFGLPRRDMEWERNLPEAYVPLSQYEGPVNTEWQERWNTDRGRMRAENLATEKNHFSTMLAPRSKRTQYGLDLTRALVQRMHQVVAAQGGKLAIFQVDDHTLPSEEDQMYVLNGRYYRVSKRQFETNWIYVHEGFECHTVPITIKDWRVGPDDGHYNEAATDQLMRDLAERLKHHISNKTS